jgi:hypothetical protein
MAGGQTPSSAPTASRPLTTRELPAGSPTCAQTRSVRPPTFPPVMPCYLVYATAPTGMRARDANDALNAYVADASHGIAVVHDHFTGRPHGGFAIVFPRNKHELERPAIQARSKAGRFTAIGSSSRSHRSDSTPKWPSHSTATATRASTRCAQPNPPIRATGGNAIPKHRKAPLVESKHGRRDFNQPSGASGRESSPLAAATWRSTPPSLHPQSP